MHGCAGLFRAWTADKASLSGEGSERVVQLIFTYVCVCVRHRLLLVPAAQTVGWVKLAGTCDGHNLFNHGSGPDYVRFSLKIWYRPYFLLMYWFYARTKVKVKLSFFLVD